jgi:hypothetical protein
MPGKDSLIARRAAGGVLATEHADVLRESVPLMVREIMEAKIAPLPVPSSANAPQSAGGRSATAIGRGTGTLGSARSSRG